MGESAPKIEISWSGFDQVSNILDALMIQATKRKARTDSASPETNVGRFPKRGSRDSGSMVRIAQEGSELAIISKDH